MSRKLLSDMKSRRSSELFKGAVCEHVPRVSCSGYFRDLPLPGRVGVLMTFLTRDRRETGRTQISQYEKKKSYTFRRLRDVRALGDDAGVHVLTNGQTSKFYQVTPPPPPSPACSGHFPVVVNTSDPHNLLLHSSYVRAGTDYPPGFWTLNPPTVSWSCLFLLFSFPLSTNTIEKIVVSVVEIWKNNKRYSKIDTCLLAASVSWWRFRWWQVMTVMVGIWKQQQVSVC